MTSYHTIGLTNVGNWQGDPCFDYARESLQQMGRDLYHNNLIYPSAQTGTNSFLQSQLNAWEQCSQNLQQHVVTARMEQQSLLNTAFKFEPDHFKMLVDCRGYHPSEIKVNVTNAGIELAVSHEQTLKSSAGCGFANRTITRLYEMPMHVSADKVVCNLTPEGTLMITAPWIANF